MRREEQRRLAVFALYQHDLTGRSLADLLDNNTLAFTRELAEGTLAERERIDPVIARNLKGWTLDRLEPLDRNLLRVAIYELINRTDVPPEVAIDQAIELAKLYCSADAPGLVNGILASVLREIEHPLDRSNGKSEHSDD